MPGCGHSRLRAWRDAAAVTDQSRAGVERLLAQHGKGLDVEVPRFAGALALFNSAYRVINARKQCVMAARVMGASRWPAHAPRPPRPCSSARGAPASA